MIDTKLQESFLERPEFALALMLSTPSPELHKATTSIKIEFINDEVVTRVSRPSEKTGAFQLLCSKVTIKYAIILYKLIILRGPKYHNTILEQVSDFARNYTHLQGILDKNGVEHSLEYQSYVGAKYLFDSLEISDEMLAEADLATKEAMIFLEREGLAIDPVFSAGLMVLAGLIPVHFSVRTPKGEDVHREIKVNATLWSLSLTKIATKEKSFTDVEFKFRTVGLVRKMIQAVAKEFIEGEEEARVNDRKPILARNGVPRAE